MFPRFIDVTALTRQRVVGELTAWQTPNGPYNVEHLAGRSPRDECLVFYWSPQHNWQVVNVTAKTGAKIAGPLTSWQTHNGSVLVEHLAGRSPTGDLLVFWWSPQHDWQVVNVSQKTGQKIANTVTSWQTPNGPFNVEHPAGQAPNGDLLVFWWSPQHDWQVVNVTQKTRRSIASGVASWVTPNGPMLVEHLAAADSHGSLIVFWWSPAHDWQAIDVTALTGQRIQGTPTSWLAGNVEHLAARAPDDTLQVFWWTPATNWQVVNTTRFTGDSTGGAASPYQLPSGEEQAELLATRSPDGSLILNWWKPSRDWQSLNVSKAIGDRRFSADPVTWITPNGRSKVEHFAAPDEKGSLLVVWMDAQPRDLTDAVGGPYKELERVRNVRRKVLAILWDPHRATDPAPTPASVESVLFGPQMSVRDYYLQASNGYFTIEKAGVLGWYDALYPAEHYWGPTDTGDTNGDGWIHGHVEKWAEAIRRAGQDFNFAPFDAHPADGNLRPDELALLIIIPQNSPFGTNRTVVGREFPQSQPLVVGGVTFGTIAEAYIGNPPNLGVAAHELNHLLLHGADMYFTFPQPFAAGMYSLMDGTYQGTHLDPFHKLKCGWLRPQVVLESGVYSLSDVETHYKVLILMNPARSTDEYFIVENRWRGTSYDQPMSDVGIAVWHIMENQSLYGTLPPPPGVDPMKWNDVAPNEWGRRGIRMIRPVSGPGIFDDKALWDGSDPETGYDLLSDDANPQHAMLKWGDGTPSGFALRHFSAPGATMTVTIEVPF
ncbi:MAG TPA: hypothetical protein VFT72_08255 [Opitutaceae bacterium]|nr:hypothetical protein [Opitutaceae bacterium]